MNVTAATSATSLCDPITNLDYVDNTLLEVHVIRTTSILVRIWKWCL